MAGIVTRTSFRLLEHPAADSPAWPRSLNYVRSSGPPTRIGSSLKVVGDIIAQQDLVIAGEVRGAIDLPDHALTVTPAGRVRGAVFARLVVVEGLVDGDITASDLVELRPTARVQGDVAAPRVTLAEGANFDGRIDMKRTEAAVRVARYRLGLRNGSERATVASAGTTRDTATSRSRPKS